MINLIVQRTHGVQQGNYKEFIEVIGFGIQYMPCFTKERMRMERYRVEEIQVKGGRKVKLTFSPEPLQTVAECRTGQEAADLN